MIALVWMLGCGPGAPEQVADPEPPRPNVVLITLDTTRADRIGAYGHAAAHTENIDALAARGRRYDNAISPVPLTIPSHGAMFTGRYPARLGVRSNGDAAIDDDEKMLAERFEDAGYATVGSAAAFVTTREWGFGQGHQQFFDEIPRGHDFWHAERKGAEVVDDLLGWLERRPQSDERPVFLWAHLYDPHFPFLAGEPWLSECEGRPYDAELAYTDDQVGRLVSAFDPANTLFVVVGDHGEGLGDHGELAHGLFVYGSTARVPWLIAGPGVEAGQVVDQPVSLVDVAPTVLDLVGLPAPTDIDGQVVPASAHGPIGMESWQLSQRFGIAPHLAVIEDGYKLIDLPRPELYRVTDLAESENLAEGQPERVAALKRALESLQFDPPVADPSHPATPAMTRQLEALGYVEGGFLGDPSAPVADPKDRAQLLSDVQRLEVLSLEGRMDEADALVESLAASWPDVVEFQLKRARIDADAGDLEAATRRIEDLLVRDPENALAIHFLGSLLAARGRFEEAALRFQDAAERMPYARRLRVMAVASLFEVEGGTKPGFELAKNYLQEDGDDYALCGVLGVELVRHRQMEQGLTLLELGLKAERPERDVAYLLAAAATGRGDLVRAQALLELEVKTHPTNAHALMALLRMEGKRGEWQLQVDQVRQWLGGHGRGLLMREHQPPLPMGLDPARVPSAKRTAAAMADFLHVEAQALYNLGRYDEAREALRRGFDIDPDRANLLLLDANLLARDGKTAEGQARFEQAKSAKEREGQADPWDGLEDRKKKQVQ